MASKTTCYITNSEEGRGAFAIRADTDEMVYIPQGIAERLELEEFDEVEAIVVKNQRDEPPWMAIRARRLNAEAEEAQSA